MKSYVMRPRGRWKAINRSKAMYPLTEHPLSYSFVRKIESLVGTARHCYVHPQNAAIAWELNASDASYRRAVCMECA